MLSLWTSRAKYLYHISKHNHNNVDRTTRLSWVGSADAINAKLTQWFELCNGRKYIMAYKKLKFGETEFARTYLKEKELDQFDGQADEVHQKFGELLERLVASHHKVSVSWDDYNDTYTAAVTCCDDASSNYGLILTARDETPYAALLMAVWMVYYLWPDKTWPKSSKRSGRG